MHPGTLKQSDTKSVVTKKKYLNRLSILCENLAWLIHIS